MPIAFHGTPNAPVTRNGRAARTTRDSTTRACEDKAYPVLTLGWYPRLARRNPRLAWRSHSAINSVARTSYF